ncbi:hypothetical protein G6F43_006259 [Rhizopus delemar]|nr:hypothetical protein G6F43_006259 [Rhizopus delemar]
MFTLQSAVTLRLPMHRRDLKKKNIMNELSDVTSDAQDLIKDLEKVDKVCLSIIDSAGLTTNMNDLELFIRQAKRLDGSRRTPHKSSPGMDGLPYENLHLIIGHPRCKSLVLEVYNDAINKVLFPKSWQKTCLVLLPKTGDLTGLSNWRPISLINTDCKIFTRIINSRIMGISSKLITRFQSGFMHNMFIGDYGFDCRLIMEDASKSTPISENLGVMLDQTKAYDRIHSKYLCKVLNNNSISVNMNGSLSDSIQQLRGLHQGDSISSILFNLAIEPFLLSILHNEIIDGYCLKARRLNSDLQLTAPRSVKLLTYAGDILIFINSKEEFLELQERLKVYNGASNSQVNYSKSVVFPLASRTTFNNRELKELISHNGLRWFDSQLLGHIKYLGYPM